MNLLENSQPPEVRSALRPQPSWRREIICGLLLAGGILLGLASHFGSAHALLCNLRGEQLLADFDPLRCAPIRPGATGDVQFTLQNVSWSPVEIIGANDRCDCVVVDGLPFELTSGESRRLNVRVRVDQNENRDRFEQSIVLYVNAPSHQFALSFPVLVSR